MTAFTSSAFPPNELWDFSSRIHARGGVADSCLGLQDRLGLDVNVLLFCCWVAASGRGDFHPDELENAMAAAECWRRSVILPLRELRRFLKGDVAPAPRRFADDLRRVAAESELHAERIEQLMLSEVIGRPAEGPYDPIAQVAAAAGNVQEYLAALGVETDAEDRADLRHVLTAVFPAARRASVEDAVT